MSRHRLVATFVLLWLAVAVAGGENPHTDVLPAFPYQAGWLGADVAYSIPLSNGRLLWLFGDTFVGSPTAKTRAERTGMPRNSIGISQCHSQGCEMKYFWNRMYQPHPRAFFDLSSDHWFWPLDGFVDHGSLYVVLEEMRAVGTGAFGFGYSGVTLATVRNINDPPEHWQVQYQKILTGKLAIPGVSVVAGRSDFNPYPKDPGGAAWAYFFTLHQVSSKKSVIALTRLRIADLNQAALAQGQWQYLSTSRGWKHWTTAGTLAADAKTVLSDGYSEFTARFHPEGGYWLATAPGKALTEARAVYSTAASIAGPWTSPQTLLEYPEMKKSSRDYTPRVFCYAAKEHPELEHSGSMVITYACNSLTEEEIFRNMDLYRPRMVVRPIPPL